MYENSLVIQGEEVRRMCVDDIDDTTIIIEDKLPVSSKLCGKICNIRCMCFTYFMRKGI